MQVREGAPSIWCLKHGKMKPCTVCSLKRRHKAAMRLAVDRAYHRGFSEGKKSALKEAE